MDMDASGIRSSRITPVDCIVTNDPARRVVERSENRVSHVLRNIQGWYQSLDFLPIDDFGSDALELVDLSPPTHRAQRTVSVGEGEMARLREHHIEIQFGGQFLVQLDRAVIEPHTLGS